jgi:HK97 family phage portal protein
MGGMSIVHLNQWTEPATPPSTNGALQSAAVWACCRLISQALMCLPAHVFEETADGKVKATRHPSYPYLTKRPNPDLNFPNWLQTTVLHLLIYGNAFTLPAEFEGELLGLFLLDPSRMTITVGKDSTQLTYKYKGLDGKVTEYKSDQLLHFRIFSLDGIVGLSPLEYHWMTFDLESSSRVYAASLYKNGGRPSGVLEYPGQLKEEQVNDIRRNWQTMHSGPNSAGQIAILSNGTKYTSVSLPLQQLEYMALQSFSVIQIARIYGVPPHLIGAETKPTYASVEQQSLEFRQYTAQPIVTAIESTIAQRLLEPPFFYRINMAGFERGDIKTRYAAYAQARQWGWASANDIRELEDLNKIGPRGDIYLTPLNMEPASVAADTVAELDNEEEDLAPDAAGAGEGASQ